jgi:hypothetical protein
MDTFYPVQIQQFGSGHAATDQPVHAAPADAEAGIAVGVLFIAAGVGSAAAAGLVAGHALWFLARNDGPVLVLLLLPLLCGHFHLALLLVGCFSASVELMISSYTLNERIARKYS